MSEKTFLFLNHSSVFSLIYFQTNDQYYTKVKKISTHFKKVKLVKIIIILIIY